MTALDLQAYPGAVALQLVRLSRPVAAGHDHHMVVPAGGAALCGVTERPLHRPERALGVLISRHGHYGPWPRRRSLRDRGRGNRARVIGTGDLGHRPAGNRARRLIGSL